MIADSASIQLSLEVSLDKICWNLFLASRQDAIIAAEPSCLDAALQSLHAPVASQAARDGTCQRAARRLIGKVSKPCRQTRSNSKSRTKERRQATKEQAVNARAKSVGTRKPEVELHAQVSDMSQGVHPPLLLSF
eukprot:COSAG02_NODE_602_length_19711_cov_20.882674_13_plen_135_part_00